MSEELRQLIEMARHVQMTSEQQEEQRISFAYGNAKLANDYITKEEVVQASQRLKETSHEQPPGTAR